MLCMYILQLREQQLRLQQQMNAPPERAPRGPSGVAAQPHQKLNVISSRDAENLRSGISAPASSSSGGPIAPGPIVAKKAPKKVSPGLGYNWVLRSKFVKHFTNPMYNMHVD